MASLATFSASTGPNFFFGTHFTVAVYKIILCPFIYRLKHNRVGILCVTFCKKWKLFLADFNFKWNDIVMYGVYYPEGYSIWIYLGGGGMPLISDPPTNRRKKNFHPSPPEFTSESTPLPPEKKNHKNNFLYRNTQSFALMIYQYTTCKSLP